MNIKRNIFAVLAAAVLLASCSQDELMTDTRHDGLVPVTLSAAVGNGVQTRAATTDEGPLDRCLIQILEKEKDEAEWTKGAVQKMDEVNGKYTLTNIMLNPEKDYTFLFWADGGISYYTATDLTDVTIASETGEAGIAYQTSEVWDGGENIEVELTHAVTKVSLQSTTVVPTSKTIDITIPKKYSSFNVLEGKVSGDATTYTHSSPGSGSDGDQFFFYALVEDATQNLTLNAGGGDVNITSVPLGPNKHVILRGDVDGAGWTTVNFTASVDVIWGNDENVDILGYNYDANTGIYNVTSEKGLRAMAEFVNGGETNINITLAKDITLTEVWTPIGNYSNPYTGTFDGNDHAISGLTIDQSGTDYAGLIGYIGNGGAVKNLTLKNVNITAARYTGAVAGMNNGTIENCSVSGTVKSSSNNAGGITGYNYGTITGCSASGNVSANAQAGGIVGYFVTGNITDCHSSATVEGNYSVGGVAGHMDSNTTLTACSSTGSVTATGSDEVGAGGVVGHITKDAAVTACYATGNVTATQGNNAGGVAGSSGGGTITACYHATGTVSGSARVGGVLGLNQTGIDLSGTVTACYWQNDQSQGIGEDQVGTAETTKVEDNWAAAIDKMNAALAITDINWRYVQADDSSLPPVLKTAI